ncbi:enoyl-CoA hydratase [Coralloluteibacterium stylophorae]|uniref:Enoyl-CoA hydratase n=1 Tax=Coralloluteibacterium stylophorae TaxID=1776034 RepID=A0A8J8AZG6_9GAMM|nr:enoyl-CoA hydratase [Coralloluteibacterium stylophorae]MBS7458417.1 enoyl-CoA hydratase [Coralloluteibacterium stylophorae]
MSDYQNLTLEIRGHTALVTIDNPPANTWTTESLRALERLVRDLDARRDVYSLVITGQGQKFFSAGADLKQFASGDKEAARPVAEAFGAAFEALSAFRGVSIAAINGYAMGGGLECALACDIRIIEEQAQVALPEATVGLLPCGGGTQNLTALVGEGWAKRLILCGERIDAQTALRIGAVEEVVPTGGALEAALALAAKVDRQSPSSVAASKTLIQHGRHGHPARGLELERERFLGLFDTQDQVEGVNAFLEKRTPEWKNA